MEIALVVHVRHSRLEPIAPDVAHLAGLVFARRLDDGPVAHHGCALRLAVDGPGWPVIVGLALLRAMMDVGEDAEAELWILVQNLALRPVVDEVRPRERRVEQDVPDHRADLLPALGAAVRGQDVTTRRRELLERISHAMSLLDPDLDAIAAKGSTDPDIPACGASRPG